MTYLYLTDVDYGRKDNRVTLPGLGDVEGCVSVAEAPFVVGGRRLEPPVFRRAQRAQRPARQLDPLRAGDLLRRQGHFLQGLLPGAVRRRAPLRAEVLPPFGSLQLAYEEGPARSSALWRPPAQSCEAPSLITASDQTATSASHSCRVRMSTHSQCRSNRISSFPDGTRNRANREEMGK